MYKITGHFSSAKLVLVKRSLADGTCSALIVVQQPVRNCSLKSGQTPALPPPPSCKAPPKKKSNKLFWGTVGATVLTGAAVVYAKNSPDARNWLETNMPRANDFVALVYQENTTYWKFSVNNFNKITTKLSHFLFGKEGVSPLDFKQQSEQNLDEDAKNAFAKKDYQLPPAKFEPLYTEERVIGVPEIEHEATLIQTEKSDPQKPPPVKITKDMVELEHDMHEMTKVAIDNYKKATKFATEYNKALYRIVEPPLEDLDKKLFTQLAGARKERDAIFKTAKDASVKAKCAIETLDRMIKAGVQAPPESTTATLRYIKQFRADISAAEDGFNDELEKGVLADKYWNKVEQARKAYKDELQCMFPGIDLSARKLEVKGDTDLLLLYTLKQVTHLQSELAELETVRDLKISRAIECHDEKALIDAKVEDMIKQERLVKDREFLKKWLELQADANRNLRDQLKKQLEIQQELLIDKLKRKEAEVVGRYNRAVSEQVEKERILFKKELAAMAGKLQAIEQTLKQRAKAEAEARRSQSLWAAAEALLAATRRPSNEVNVDNELKALEKAGKDDKLVQTVLKGIPQEVREKGIVTEKALKDRFEKLEQTTAKVALVGREGASLPVYFLSWLQSKLLFQKFAEIPQDEMNNLPTDFSKLDAFEIMQRAKHFMERGDLGAALRYLNLLQGGPRAAAKPWFEAAKRHLEVKQAAEAVMAHASVSGLLYL